MAITTHGEGDSPLLRLLAFSDLLQQRLVGAGGWLWSWGVWGQKNPDCDPSALRGELMSCPWRGEAPPGHTGDEKAGYSRGESTLPGRE